MRDVLRNFFHAKIISQKKFMQAKITKNSGKFSFIFFILNISVVLFDIYLNKINFFHNSGRKNMSHKQHLQFIFINTSTALVSTMIGQNFVDGIFIIGTFILGIVAIDIALAFDMRDCGVRQVNVLISWCFTIGLMLGILFAHVFVRFSPSGTSVANWEAFRHAVHWCSYSFLACLGWWRFSHWFFPES